MPNWLVRRWPDGVRPPARLELSGQVPWVLDNKTEVPVTRFEAFAVNWFDAEGNIAFHFNPRPEPGVVTLNSLLHGSWGTELVVPAYPFAREASVPFHLRFDVEQDRFRVFVDGRPIGEFPHRVPPSELREVRSTTFLWRLDAGDERRPPFALRRPRRRGKAVAPEVVQAFPARSEWNWVATADNPPDPEPLEAFRLFAILCTCLEEDIIEATIDNCLRQGCERVYLVDNGSSDRTVERALAAGALFAGCFDIGRFDDAVKTAHLQKVVDEVSAQEGDEHIWWLWLDADEFYEGPGGLTVREYLAGLDRRFRIVGARYFNHLPDAEPAYREGRHPLDFQPLCYEVPGPFCARGHWKHPLQRWSLDAPAIVGGGGFHGATCSESLLEPSVAVLCHHFPFRREETTRRRLERLFGQDGNGRSRITDQAVGTLMRMRLRSLEAVYRGRWEEVDIVPPCVRGYAPALQPWQERGSTLGDG